jgi:hypothetical protein
MKLVLYIINVYYCLHTYVLDTGVLLGHQLLLLKVYNCDGTCHKSA